MNFWKDMCKTSSGCVVAARNLATRTRRADVRLIVVPVGCAAVEGGAPIDRYGWPTVRKTGCYRPASRREV